MRFTLPMAYLLLLGCHPSLPMPPFAAPVQGPFVDVETPPPAAHLEYVPPQPHREAVWIDGQWTWDGEWRWDRGGWVVPPPGAFFAPWRTFRRADGMLLFAEASWRDAHGAKVPPPRVLGPAGATHTAHEPETQTAEEP